MKHILALEFSRSEVFWWTKSFYKAIFQYHFYQTGMSNKYKTYGAINSQCRMQLSSMKMVDFWTVSLSQKNQEKDFNGIIWWFRF